jgi:hypothetical protein
MKAMNSPEVSGWHKTSQSKHVEKNWTEECQGVTTDGQCWFFSSNNKMDDINRQRIYKFTEDMEFLDFFPVGKFGCGHLGGIDFYKGIIYAAMEQPSKVLLINSNLQSATEAKLNGKTTNSAPPQGKSFPWCAINPWNGYLYSSKFDNVSEIYGYDPKDNFKHVTTLELPIKTDRVQGGCISRNGHLLLASDESHNIRCFSMLNGTYLGSTSIEVSDLTREEVEGIAIWEGRIFEGVQAQIHVILLDNQPTVADDVFFKHFSVPNPENL